MGRHLNQWLGVVVQRHGKHKSWPEQPGNTCETLKNIKECDYREKDQGHDANGGVPAQQARGPEFKLQDGQKSISNINKKILLISRTSN
jgi:hypothetical protein